MKNKKTNEIIIYTSETCNHCLELKKQLKEKNVKYTEKPTEKYDQDWYREIDLTGLAILPTVVINNTRLIAGRDFQNPDQLVNIIDYINGSGYKEISFEEKTQESLKTINYNINMTLNRMFNQLKNIESKLNKENEK
jgi:glutaredoxin